MTKRLYFFSILVAAVLGGLVSVAVYNYVTEDRTADLSSFEEKQQIRFSNILSDTNFTVPEGLNFVYAAEIVTPAVVHIKSSFNASERGYRNPLEELFDFGPRNPGRRGQGFGSGVIISDDGFIATNNHVIDNANVMEVTLSNGRKFRAKLVGKDPTTDLALVKIDAKNLPFVRFGDSDRLKIGEWALAIGNPFAQGTPYDLTSTVTAGIISAKGRSIGILQDSLRIESFIQTDAAVNPGNSGGALVNLKGELIGINTAIASPTGSFSGYSFAVPVSIVSKVMNDLLEYGAVQRALLGVTINDIDSDLAESESLEEYSGVYIVGVSRNGAAQEAGIEPGDIIISINGRKVNTVSQLQELIAQKRPGDKVNVQLVRDGSDFELTARLKSAGGSYDVVRPETTTLIEGAQFKDVPAELLKSLNIGHGVQITTLEDGKLREAGVREGFIITSVDKMEVNSVGGLKDILEDKKGEVSLLLGVYPNGEKAWYSIRW